MSTLANSTWMIYGAYGYTGRLIVEESVRRGYNPILAGRNANKLAELAQRHHTNSPHFNSPHFIDLPRLQS